MSLLDWALINTKNLDDWFHEEELSKLGIIFKIIKNETKICTINGYEFFNITLEKLSNDELNTLEKALSIAGLFPLQISLTDQKQNISSRITTKDQTFKDKLLEIIKGRKLVPDTNTLLNKLFSTLEIFAGGNFFQNFSMVIPRLVVLEMERISKVKSGSNKQKKREVMMSYAELTLLKNNKAGYLPELSREILYDFTRIAGDLNTDSWIRREIKDEAFKELTESNPHKYTLVTSDLINALSSDAEDLPTIYISKLPYSSIQTNILRIQVVRFLIILSILFEEITIKINSKIFIFRGIWEGKTTTNWINDVISFVNFSQLIKTISQNFDTISTDEIVKILTIIKGELRTPESQNYLTEKLKEIRKSSTQIQKLQLCKKLKPYVDWYLQGII